MRWPSGLLGNLWTRSLATWCVTSIKVLIMISSSRKSSLITELVCTYNYYYGHTNLILPKLYGIVWFTLRAFFHTHPKPTLCINLQLNRQSFQTKFQSLAQIFQVIFVLANCSKFKFLCTVFEIQELILFSHNPYYFGSLVLKYFCFLVKKWRAAIMNMVCISVKLVKIRKCTFQAY